ncbi:acyl carrier protein [Streptomyces sp. 8N706]|uniref:acyl carrier protein n=1 Tax=Streptomyces sp. 8N706 TaxID=3457416 RepID=UPI003FCF0439
MNSKSTQTRLAELWSRVLDVPDVAPADNFFALGGGSMDAVILLALVNEEFATLVRFSELSELETLRDMADHIDRARVAD